MVNPKLCNRDTPSLLEIVLAAREKGPGSSSARDALWLSLEHLATRLIHGRLKRWRLSSHEIEDARQELVLALFLSADKYDPKRSQPKAYFEFRASKTLSAWIRQRQEDRLVLGEDLDRLPANRSGQAEVRFDFPEGFPLWLRAVLLLRTNGYRLCEIAPAFDMSVCALRQAVHRSLRSLQLEDGAC